MPLAILSSKAILLIILYAPQAKLNDRRNETEASPI
jgi:hypothetical protein